MGVWNNKAQGLGFMVQGLGFRVLGLGTWVSRMLKFEGVHAAVLENALFVLVCESWSPILGLTCSSHSSRFSSTQLGDCQNYGPFLAPYYNTGPNLGDPKRDHNFDNPPNVCSLSLSLALSVFPRPVLQFHSLFLVLVGMGYRVSFHGWGAFLLCRSQIYLCRSKCSRVRLQLPGHSHNYPHPPPICPHHIPVTCASKVTSSV